MTTDQKPEAQADAQFQMWCDTCEGSGMIWQEHQIGVVGVGGNHPCPDCDGKGFLIVSRFTQAQLDAAIAEAVAKEREKVSLLQEAALTVIGFNRQQAEDQYGDANKAESWSCVAVLRAAIRTAQERT